MHLKFSPWLAIRHTSLYPMLFLLMNSIGVAQNISTEAFTKRNLEGSITIYDLNNNKWYFSDEVDARHRTSPASTFKILNSLIALEEAVVENEDDLFKWDSIERFATSWNKGMSLREAYKVSAVWVYQQVAKEVGNEKYDYYLNKVHYGNTTVGPDVDRFWLDGSLKISPIEQVNFLVDLYKENLPFSKSSFQRVKSIMLEEEASSPLYAKTGWAVLEGKDIGWYVGFIIVEENPYFFATRVYNPIEIKNRNFLTGRKEITLEVMQEMGMLERKDISAKKMDSAGIDSLVSLYNFQGVVYVSKAGQTVFSQGYGLSCPDGNSIHTDSTVFEIGSTAKQFTAFALIQLALNGDLELTDSMRKFFPEVPEDKSNITIHQLLTHTSGLQMYHDKRGPLENISREKALRRIFRQKLVSSPGETFNYSNSGYTLAALIIEKVTGTSYIEYLNKTLQRISPDITVGLYGHKIWEREKVACGHSFKKSGHPYDRGETSWAGVGAGYLMISIKNYAQYLNYLFNAKEAVSYRDTLFQPYADYTFLEGDYYYGYGWVLHKQKGHLNEIYHNGGDTGLGFITTIRFYPDTQTLVILSSNYYNQSPHPIFEVKNGLEKLLDQGAFK